MGFFWMCLLHCSEASAALHQRLSVVTPGSCARVGGTGLKWTEGKSSWLVPSPPAKRLPPKEVGAAAPNASDCIKTAFYRTFEEVPEEFRHRIR